MSFLYSPGIYSLLRVCTRSRVRNQITSLKYTYSFTNRLITTYNYFTAFDNRIEEESEIKVKLSSLTFIWSKFWSVYVDV